MNPTGITLTLIGVLIVVFILMFAAVYFFEYATADRAKRVEQNCDHGDNRTCECQYTDCMGEPADLCDMPFAPVIWSDCHG